MRSIDIKIHEISGVAGPPLDRDAIVVAFEAAGIDVRFTQGATLPSDPALNPNFHYRDLIAGFRREDPGSGHLVLGGLHPSWNTAIAGELADLASRGLSVVYTRSTYIAQGGRPALLQTVVHELGHLLNLAHDDIDRSYDSAMNQARDRDQPTTACWQVADRQAQSEQSHGQPAYWTRPNQLPACHPFALIARFKLNRLSDDRLLPWRGRYDGQPQGAEDRWHAGSALAIDFEAPHFELGGVLAFTARFTNRGGDVISVPADLGPTFDTLIIRVRKPDGSHYQHSPRGLACSTATRPLLPGEVLYAPFATIRGPGGLALDQIGVYELQVIAPALGVASIPAPFEVIGSQASARLPRALATASTPLRLAKAARRTIADLLRQPDLSPLTRGYLALSRLADERDAAAVPALEEMALAPVAPNEVRHLAAMARVKRLIANGGCSVKQRKSFCRDYLNQAGDALVAARICEEMT